MSMAGVQEPSLDSIEARKIIRIVKNYVGEKLRRKGLYVPGYDTEDINSIAIIAITLRRVGDELEAADSEFFSQMCSQLNITPTTAYPMFQGIADEIFETGKNWGRIVAFLTFGSTLAVHCACREDMGFAYVDTIVAWIYKYMIIHLDCWMKENGGWVSSMCVLCCIIFIHAI